MDPFQALSIFYLIASILWIFRYPVVVIGVQVFATPVFGLALETIGLGFGSFYLILVLTCFSLLVHLYRNNSLSIIPTTYPEYMMLLLMFLMLLSLTYTPSEQYGVRKTLGYVLIAFPIFFVSRNYLGAKAKTTEVFAIVAQYAIFILIFYAAYVLTNPVEQHTAGNATRIRTSFFGPLPLGYIVATMFPFVLFYFVTSKALGKLLSLAGMFAIMVIIAATGSRGPTLALGIAILIVALQGRNLAKLLFSTVLLVTVVLGSLSLVSLNTIEGLGAIEQLGGLNRIFGIDERASGTRSSDGRIELYSQAITQFLEFPLLGQGIGSFSWWYVSVDERIYPHNLFLEIAGELGLLGLVIFVSGLVYCVFQIGKLRLTTTGSGKEVYWFVICTQAIFFIGLVNASFSFDMPGQRTLFLAMGILSATSGWPVRNGRRPRRRRYR